MNTCCVIRNAAPILALCFAGSLLATPHPAAPRPKPKPTPRVVKKAAPKPVSIVSIPDAANRPDASGFRGNQKLKEYAIKGAAAQVTTGGVSDAKAPAPAPPPAEAWVPSVALDYTYIDVNDERTDGADGDTHSGAISLNMQGPGGLSFGFNYDYSNTELGAPLYSVDSDSHFFTTYVAKSFTPWLLAGVSGGYGNTDSDISSRDGNSTTDTDTWTVSPFVAAVFTKGSFFSATSVAYQFTDQDGGDTQSVIAEQTVGYAVTEQLAISALARYHNQIDGSSDADDDWLTVGGRLSFQINQQIGTYVGYEYDALNDSFENHTFKGGVSITF